MQKSVVRASFEEKSPQESEFLPSLGHHISNSNGTGSGLGENKNSHGRNHKEAETLPIKPINKFKKNELTS